MAEEETYYTFTEDNTFLDSSGAEVDIGAEIFGEKITVGDKDKKKTKKPRPVNFGKGAYMSYPIARTMQEKTGDTLLIKCVKFIPPSEGASNFSVKGTNLLVDLTYGTGKNARTVKNVVNTQEVRTKAAEAGFTIPEPELGAKFTDANTRMRKSKVKYNIELPIPQEINDSNTVTWGDDKMNALELAGIAIASEFMKEGAVDGIQKAQQAIKALTSGVKIDGLTEQTQNAIRAAISGAAVGALGSNVSAESVIARSTGQIMNNNLELLFKGMNLRSFPYSITFSPRSFKESNVVKAIIRSLKQSMSPKAESFTDSAQGIFLSSPDVFQLEYRRDGKAHPFLNNFKLCALTGMNINYTNAGTYTSYNDGTPVNIRMDLTFKELNPIYAEDYLPGNGSGSGVGY